MDMNVNKVTETLKTCANSIDEAREAVKDKGLGGAMPFAGKIRSTSAEIKGFGKLENVSIPAESRDGIKEAIQHFLTSANEMEKAVPQAVALMGTEAVNTVRDNLQQVLDQLDEERGGKVKGKEPDGGI